MEKISYHGKELLPIKSDIVFKIVFGKPENTGILAKLLEALLDIKINDPKYITLTNTELSDLCEINFLELKKVPTEWYNDKEMWALFIATNDEKVIDMLARENQDIKKAVEILEYVSSDRNERFRIDQIDKARRDHLAENAANRQEGFKEGIEIGIECGIERGIERGIEQEKIILAKAALREGATLDFVVKITQLDKDLIEKLRDEL